MANEKFVVIGAGPAGLQAALTLRENIPQASITVITRDTSMPYRPSLLPKMIAGQVGEQEIYPCDINFWEEHHITLRRSQEVKAVDLHKNQLITGHRESIGFDGLVIAVGGIPRIPEYLALFRDLMWTLKTVQDAKAWMAHIAQIRSVLIIGGDLTSLAVTRALLDMGKEVIFAVTREALWPLRYDPDVVAELSKRLEMRGASTLYFEKFKGIAVKGDKDYEVRVADQTLRVQMIGAFFGLVPDVSFLTRSGLVIDRGILVDEFLNTGFPTVFAAGDCAQIYHPDIGDYWISIGVDNALALGQIAALNLVGCTVKATVPLPSIFDREDVKVNTSWWVSF